jgi:tetratricopeptide (TPR) repeat protein
MNVLAGGAAVAIYYLADSLWGKQLFEKGFYTTDDEVAIANLSKALRHKLTKNDLATAYSTRGGVYQSKKKYDEAIRDFSEAIRVYPDWSYPYFGRGWTYQLRGEPDKAFPDYAEAIRYDANSAWSYYNRGLLYLRKQEWDPAIADFDEAVRCLPGNSTAFLARGLCLLGKKDADGALANFDGAISVNSANAEAYLFRSNVYFMKGETDKQLRDYEEAGRLARTAWNNRPRVPSWSSSNQSPVLREVNLAYHDKDFDRAIELSNKTLLTEMAWKQASPVLMSRGNAFAAKGDFDRALIDYDQAVAFNPENAGAHVDRGRALEKRKQRDQALRDYAEAIRLDPNMWEAYFNRALAFRTEGRLDEAIADLTKVIELKPNLATGYVARAALYLQKNETDRALKDSNSAVASDPNSAEAYLNRSRAYAHLKEFPKALADLEATATLKTTEPSIALNAIAWFRATCPETVLRDGRKAVEAAKESCELTHWKNWGFIDTLATAYAETGDFEQAIKYQKQCLEMAPAQSSDIDGARQRLQMYEHHLPFRDDANR